MIKAVFRRQGRRLTGFTVSGHAGDEEEGRNLICAAVSSAVYMTVNTVTEIIGCEIDCEEADGYMDVDLSRRDLKSRDASVVIDGLRLHLEELSKTYPDFITLEE